MNAIHLASRNLKELLRDPLSSILGILLPGVLLLLFSTLGAATGMDVFAPASLTPGIAVFSFAFLVMFGAMLLARDRERSFMDRLLMSPLRAVDFIAAYSAPLLLLAFLQVAAAFLVGAVLGLALGVWLLPALAVLFLVALFATTLGMALGSLLTENQIAGVGSLFLVVASLFSGAWMDLDAIGGVFFGIARLLPFYHAVILVRGFIAGAPVAGGSHLVWVIGYAVGGCALAACIFGARMRRR